MHTAERLDTLHIWGGDGGALLLHRNTHLVGDVSSTICCVLSSSRPNMTWPKVSPLSFIHTHLAALRIYGRKLFGYSYTDGYSYFPQNFWLRHTPLFSLSFSCSTIFPHGLFFSENGFALPWPDARLVISPHMCVVRRGVSTLFLSRLFYSLHSNDNFDLFWPNRYGHSSCMAGLIFAFHLRERENLWGE